MQLKAGRTKVGQYLLLVPIILTMAVSTACGQPDVDSTKNVTLTIYSGRGEELVKPIVDQFKQLTGIDVQVRWGKTAELAATILEEGKNSPADIFYAQSPGALGALQDDFIQLPMSVLEKVDPRFRSPTGSWVGISGRARTIAYNTKTLSESELPGSIWGFTDPVWKGRIGWAPTNSSFQVMVTAMRSIWGEEKTREWLEGIQANEPKVYPKNTSIVRAVGAGEIDVGFVNHYYLHRFLEEQGIDFPARNFHTRGGDPGALIMVSGIGILSTSPNQTAALEFTNFLLSEVGQQYFTSKTFEYPVTEGIKTHHSLVPLSEIETPMVELKDLADLKESLTLLRKAGIL